MQVVYGTIEYFELLGLQDKLKGRVYDKFYLPSLDILRNQVAMQIEAADDKRRAQIKAKQST